MDGFKCYFEECCCIRAISPEQVTEDRQEEKLRLGGWGASRRVALKSLPSLKDKDL